MVNQPEYRQLRYDRNAAQQEQPVQMRMACLGGKQGGIHGEILPEPVAARVRQFVTFRDRAHALIIRTFENAIRKEWLDESKEDDHAGSAGRRAIGAG
jgi:hypothetical protein